MTTQPEALRLADSLNEATTVLDEAFHHEAITENCNKAAAKLRLLHAVNQELLEALQELLAMPDYDGTAEKSVTRHKAKSKARAAIKKAEEVTP